MLWKQYIVTVYMYLDINRGAGEVHTEKESLI